jgi:transposase
MVKVKQFTGIDISKLTFDTGIPGNEESKYSHKKFSNEITGFQAFEKLIPPGCTCVMEASGSYYLPLATYLYGRGIEVMVVNPLAVKYFSRMRMTRAKTDKKDAALIAEYAKQEKPLLWKPKADHLLELQQLQTALDGFIGRKTELSNQQESFIASGIKAKTAFNIVKKEIEHITAGIKKIEVIMKGIIEKYHKDLFVRLKSIPGIGNRTAMMLIMITDGYTKFETAKQIVAYIGLSPRIYDSGTSVKGKARICKMGMSQMRALLYMCSMQAKTYNADCKTMYTRLKAKGKNGKLILIAIANKLVRQSFAIAKGEVNYQENLVV